MSYIGTKYPDQVASIKHSSASGYKTLAVRGILTLATAENGYNPSEPPPRKEKALGLQKASGALPHVN